MTDNSIYNDIAKRTDGDIYIGVVGPVRTGKSTFIHKFLDSIVIPNIENEYDRQRTLDEVPQSASGKTVMTTEPKFVPDESVKISVGDSTELCVKMIDCVGYMVDGALGLEEDGERRMVTTPWSEEEMPFERAAEIGTQKVIGEHSTIGILVTTDGTITDIPRESYIHAEERVARELSELGKPFLIVLNSATPESEEARALAEELEEKYGVPVALLNCRELNEDDIREILGLLLGEFPVRMLNFSMPSWCEALDSDHRLVRDAIAKIEAFTDKVYKLGDIPKALSETQGIVQVSLSAADGTGEFSIPISQDEYYATIKEVTGLNVDNEKALFTTLKELAAVKSRYDKIASALSDVEEKGYGIVMPSPDELVLEEPKLVKQSGAYGVKMTAHADSIHMIKAGIKTELCPVVGTESQSEEVVKYLSDELAENPSGIWDYKLFGRSLFDLASDGLNTKIAHMPDESREKMGETLEKIINEGANGLICILL